MDVTAVSLDIAAAAFAVLVVYYAYTLGHRGGRAPRSWWGVIGAFLLFLVGRVLRIVANFSDVPNPIAFLQSHIIPLIVVVTLSIALYDLNRTFDRQLRKDAAP